MQDVRDVAIIVLAIESIIVGGLLCFLIFQLMRLIKMLREEIKPLLESTNETVSTVRGTTTFVSQHVVSPIVSAAGFFSGVGRVAQMLTTFPKKTREAPAGQGDSTPGAPQDVQMQS